ncbi:PKD domain-containing protein [Enterovibrio nigricans DSM 22720]|uniref:PKD domain-containing protein n=2 Tax=Enterovibrio nigricans TaxID=504469 RepID=A0A1T4USV9_9GAMM|nr:PKD domain-containing protein [Enterovibrio nigricans DSM 22720]
MAAIWPDDNFESLGEPSPEKSISPFLVSPAEAYSGSHSSSSENASSSKKAEIQPNAAQRNSAKEIASSPVSMQPSSRTDKAVRSNDRKVESNTLVHHTTDGKEESSTNNDTDKHSDKGKKVLVTGNQPSQRFLPSSDLQTTHEIPTEVKRSGSRDKSDGNRVYVPSSPPVSAHYAPRSRLREIAYIEPANAGHTNVKHLRSGKALSFKKDQDGELEEFYIEVDGLNVSVRNNSYDPDGEIVHHYWDYGNGKGSLEQSPNWSYDKPGDYTIGLTVYDNDGASNTYSHVVSVDDGNVLPKADFAVQTFGLEAKADNNSFDVDGEVVMARWDFGDGRTSDAFSPEWRYKEPGAYVVTLTVLDNIGAAH